MGESFHVNILERLEGPLFRMKIFTVCLCIKLSQIWADDAVIYIAESADSLKTETSTKENVWVHIHIGWAKTV